jgi:hypothetical protein
MTKITIPDTADLLARLRDTPNWKREGFQHWKDNVSVYDRSPFEAADRIEALERALDEIIMEATSRNHAIDIARRARAEGGE